MRQDSRQENRKSSPRASRKRIRIAAAAVVALVAWAGVTVWDQMGKFQERTEKIEALKAKLEATQQINDAYKREIVRLNDPEYRQEKVRELHYSKQGETVFDIPRGNP